MDSDGVGDVSEDLFPWGFYMRWGGFCVRDDIVIGGIC